MLFVVDIGNSHTVTGIYENDTLIGHWRLQSDSKSTADELAIWQQTLFAMAGIPKTNIRGIVIASVVPSLESAWMACCRKHFSADLEHEIIVVCGDSLEHLISVLLDNPQEVGADRLVNAIAAWSLKPCKQVVIDFGTAITFDCVTEKCQYLGGTILPGIAISLEALSSKTAKLPHIDVSDAPAKIIGKSTVQAMKSGILYGYGAMVDGLVRGIRQEMVETETEEFRVIATGGMASLIAPFTTTIDMVDAMLTLKGLAIIFRKTVRR